MLISPSFAVTTRGKLGGSHYMCIMVPLKINFFFNFMCPPPYYINIIKRQCPSQLPSLIYPYLLYCMIFSSRQVKCFTKMYYSESTSFNKQLTSKKKGSRPFAQKTGSWMTYLVEILSTGFCAIIFSISRAAAF